MLRNPTGKFLTPYHEQVRFKRLVCLPRRFIVLREGMRLRYEEQHSIDEWENFIEEFFSAYDGGDMTLAEIARDVLRIDEDKLDRPTQMRIAECLRNLGFRKRRAMVRGDRTYRWTRGDVENSKDTAEASRIEGLGSIQDFSPHDEEEWPTTSGVYLLYDISDRLIYIGQSKNIKNRLKQHFEKFWFKSPIVEQASYIEIEDDTLRKQVEAILIKSLKSNAVLNYKGVDSFRG